MEGPRACLPGEFDEVIDLINATFREGMDQDIRTDYPLVFDRDRLDYMRIVKVDGKVVSHVPVAPRRVITEGDAFTVGIISPTITHPDYRRRGYATLCLRDCVRIMEEEGMAVSALWTQEATFPFYQQSGWEAAGSQGWAYQLEARDEALLAAGSFDIEPYNATDHLDEIIGIHDAEPHRIARSRREYEALFDLPKISTLVAVEGGRVAAYLMIGEGVNKPGIIEGGGEREGLEPLVKRVLQQLHADQKIQVVLPLTPTALTELVETRKVGRRRPVEEAAGVGPQMMRINDLEKLLRQSYSYLSQRSTGLEGDVCLACSDTGERVTLKFRDGEIGISTEALEDQVVLSRRQLAQLIFGAHPALEPVECAGPAGEILHAVFPFYFPIWELDHS